MSERGGDVWAFLAGVFIGGVTALLLAPAKGSETRGRIRKTAEDVYTRGGELVESGRTEAGKVIARGRRKLEDLAQKYEGRTAPEQ